MPSSQPDDTARQRPLNIRPIAENLPRGVTASPQGLPSRAPGELPDAPSPRRELPIAPIAPGSNRGAFMSAREIMSQRQRERRHEQRRRRNDIRFALIACALITLAFVAGFLWPSAPKTTRKLAAPSVPAAQREAALAKIDEAVRAKHEERLDEALALASEARRLDPGVSGADLITAEVGVLQQKPELVRSATTEAIRRGDDTADALLLQALDTWLARGLKRQSSAEAIESAERKFNRATAEELSNGAVWFFRGDIMRAGGRVSDAHSSLLAALHRQTPWIGSEFVEAKRDLARDEARGSSSPAAPEADLPPATALRRALAGGGDPDAPLARLVGSLTAWQTRHLLDDPALGGPAASDAVRTARTSANIAIPIPGADEEQKAGDSALPASAQSPATNDQ